MYFVLLWNKIYNKVKKKNICSFYLKVWSLVWCWAWPLNSDCPAPDTSAVGQRQRLDRAWQLVSRTWTFLVLFPVHPSMILTTFCLVPESPPTLCQLAQLNVFSRSYLKILLVKYSRVPDLEFCLELVVSRFHQRFLGKTHIKKVIFSGRTTNMGVGGGGKPLEPLRKKTVFSMI